MQGYDLAQLDLDGLSYKDMNRMAGDWDVFGAKTKNRNTKVSQAIQHDEL